MRDVDPNETAYQLCVKDRHVANLLSPRWEDMFWYSYRIMPLGEKEDKIVRDQMIWQNVTFTLRDRHGSPLDISTFSGSYGDFCDRKTDRLTFRSLGPPERQYENVPLGWGTRLGDVMRRLLGMRIRSNEERVIMQIASQRGLLRTLKDDQWYSFICGVNSLKDMKPFYRYKCVDGVPSYWDNNWETHIPSPISSVQWLDIATDGNTQLETIKSLLPDSKSCYDVINGVLRIHGYTPGACDEIETPCEDKTSK